MSNFPTETQTIPSDSTAGQLCTFHLGPLYLGLPVVVVQEVIRFQEMTPVPLSGPEISGLINLRGAIVTAIDLRRRLRLPDRPEGQLPMNVVVRDQDGAVSLLVDEIGDVLEVHRGQYETAPDNLDPHVRDAISGVYKLPGQLLLALDHKIATEV